MRALLRGLIAAAALSATAAYGQPAGAFVSLFDGTLKGWTIENSETGNFSIRDGALRVEAPGGWIRSAREYGDATIRAEFRFMTPDADSGLFVRARSMSGFMRGWPNNSYQIQIRNPETESRLPAVGGLFRHGTPQGETTFEAALVPKVAKPTAEWQLLEVDVIGERLTARLNGTEVLRAGGVVNPSGYIGFQGETGAVEFRRIEIQER